MCPLLAWINAYHLFLIGETYFRRYRTNKLNPAFDYIVFHILSKITLWSASPVEVIPFMINRDYKLANQELWRCLKTFWEYPSWRMCIALYFLICEARRKKCDVHESEKNGLRRTPRGYRASLVVRKFNVNVLACSNCYLSFRASSEVGNTFGCQTLMPLWNKHALWKKMRYFLVCEYLYVRINSHLFVFLFYFV